MIKLYSIPSRDSAPYSAGYLENYLSAYLADRMTSGSRMAGQVSVLSFDTSLVPGTIPRRDRSEAWLTWAEAEPRLHPVPFLNDVYLDSVCIRQRAPTLTAAPLSLNF